MKNRTNPHRPPAARHRRLLRAYNQMIRDMESILMQTEQGYLSLQVALETARGRALQSGQISREEADEIARCIKNDVNDVADMMMESGEECYEWLSLDIAMIEHRVLSYYLATARLTRRLLRGFSR